MIRTGIVFSIMVICSFIYCTLIFKAQTDKIQESFLIKILVVCVWRNEVNLNLNQTLKPRKGRDAIKTVLLRKCRTLSLERCVQSGEFNRPNCSKCSLSDT